MNHPDSKFRRQAALTLGKIASPECMEPMKKALTDQDRNVREYALMGLAHRLQEQERNDAFLAAIFPGVVPLLNDGAYDVQGPAEVLAWIDLARAEPILKSPAYFTTRNPQLRQVLEALNRKEVKVPRDSLMPLLGELDRLAEKDSPREMEYAAALVLYARNPDESTVSRLQALLRSKSEWVADAAGAGLEILAGIYPKSAVWAAYEYRGFEAMSKPLQYYHAVEDYRDEVNNGGHHQYFYNSTGDMYPTAVEALKAIGATSKAKILSDALWAFVPFRPALDNAQRRSQMEFLEGWREYRFSAADQRFYASEKQPGERLTLLLTLYALNHRNDFVWNDDNPRPGASRSGR